MRQTSNLASPVRFARPTDAPPARLTLLRAFDLSFDDEHVHIPSNAQRLLALLVLENCAVSRTYVARNLWIDASEDVRAEICAARCGGCPSRGEERWSRRQPLTSSSGLACASTTSRRSRRANELVQGRAQASAAGDEFLDDLLSDWYDEWVILRRERYRQLRLQALDALCDQLTAEQRYGDAVRVGLAVVAAEPLRRVRIARS